MEDPFDIWKEFQEIYESIWEEELRKDYEKIQEQDGNEVSE